MPTINNPFTAEPSTLSPDEFYEELYDFGGSYDPLPVDTDDECPEWIRAQLDDEEEPF